MNAISLIIDRLHVGYLGCYGNSWIETPHFDRLAAEGFTFDQALIGSPDLPAQYAQLTNAAGGPAHAHGLIAKLRAAGIHTALITDDPAVADLPWAAELDEVERVEVQSRTAPVSEIEETNLARFFAVVGQWLEGAMQPFFLWVHCGSLGAVWDAPLELRLRYAEEEEPATLDTATAPSFWLPEDFDPDQRTAISQAYAGQISLLDICLGALSMDIEQLSLKDNTLLSVMSTRGFPLGEHRRVGDVDDALYSELVHVPWLLRLPDGRGAADRSQELAQPMDFSPTVLDALGMATSLDGVGNSLLPIVHGETELLRDRAVISGTRGQRGVRTRAWYLRMPPTDQASVDPAQGANTELFAKPDDRWEINNVADRCPQVVELLEQVLAAAVTEPAATPAPLAEVLVEGLE